MIRAVGRAFWSHRHVLWAGMCLSIISATIVLAVHNSRVTARISDLRKNRGDVARALAAVDAEIHADDKIVRGIIEDINKYQETKKLMKLEMSDVLIRVQLLKEERERFENQRAAIRASLGRMLLHYDQFWTFRGQ